MLRILAQLDFIPQMKSKAVSRPTNSLSFQVQGAKFKECAVGLPDFGKSFKIIVEPGFSHEFDHAEFNGAQKIRSKNI